MSQLLFLFVIQCLALLFLLISHIHCSIIINKRDAEKPEEQWVNEGEGTALWDPLAGKGKGGEKDGGEKDGGEESGSSVHWP